jgi:hypothetical protein
MGHSIFTAIVVRGMSEPEDILPGMSGKRNILRKDAFS